MQKAIYLGVIERVGRNYIEIAASNGSGRIVGLLTASHYKKENTILLEEFYVLDGYKDYGYGQALLQSLINYLERNIWHSYGYEYTIECGPFFEIKGVREYLLDKYDFKPNNRRGFNARFVRDSRIRGNHKIYKIKGFEYRNDFFNEYGVLTTDNKILSTLYHHIIYSTSYTIFRELRGDDVFKKELFIDLIDPTFKSPFSEIDQINGFLRIIQTAELLCLKEDGDLKQIIIFAGPTKKLFRDITYKDILYPLGYRYKIRERGFVKILWQN